MTGLRGGLVAWERRRAGLDVTEAAVERRQLLAQVDDVNVHVAAAGRTRARLDLVHERAAESSPLERGIDREHAEVAGREREGMGENE